jgi:L1 cell adhesion molecule like protein
MAPPNFNSDNGIKVTNDKGRLSKEDIDKMLADAEKFKDDDARAKETIEARNNFENQLYQFKSTLNNDKVTSSIGDKTKLELVQVIEETLLWLEKNQQATKEEYETKLQELLETMKPLQEAMMSGSMPNQEDLKEAMSKESTSKESTSKEPTIADVD